MFSFCVASSCTFCRLPRISQPMTIAFTRILLHPTFAVGVGPDVQRASTFAVILGSNLGANFTLIGAHSLGGVQGGSGRVT